VTRGPLIHGALLVAALAFAYQTWTRDDTPTVDRGQFTLWDQSPESFVSLTYEADKKTVKLERRKDGDQTYLWATVTRTVEKPKPKKAPEPKPEAPADDEAKPADGEAKPADGEAKPADAKPADAEAADTKPADGEATPADASEADAKAADGAAEPEPASTAPADTAEPEAVVETKTDEFPVGETGEKLIEAVTPLLALRDLDAPVAKELERYGLAEPKLTLTVEFTNGTRTLQIGGRVYGGSDRYVRDPKSERVYVINGSNLRTLEGGDSALRDNRLIGVDREVVKGIAIVAGDVRREGVRVDAHAPGQPQHRVFWATKAEPDKEDPTLTNFMTRVEKLVPLGFEAELDATQLTEVVRFEYIDKDGDVIDTVIVFQGPGKTEDKPEYYGKSRHTRVFARLNRPLASQVAEDLAQVTEIAK